MKLRTLHRLFPALVLVTALMIAAPPGSNAETRKKKKPDTEKSEQKPELQRVPTNTFESIRNKVSGIDFFATNYGIFGHDVAGNNPGGFWPRGSTNAYIYGGGIWFGARKRVSGELASLSVIGYNPNSGASWMVPGPMGDASESANKNRLFFSTDYNDRTGEPLDIRDDQQAGVNWPVWDSSPTDSLRANRYFGYYIDDTTMRHVDVFPKGPAIISGEDVFAVYNDSDLGRYAGEDVAGHPLGVQVEQTIYSWGIGKDPKPSSTADEISRNYRDMIFLKYVIINRSSDTLFDCYMAPAMDMDIGGAANDRAKIAIDDKASDSLNLAVQWSESEAGRTYGYIGFDFLESPAVDVNRFLRKDKQYFTADEQIGLSTFQNWPIEEDPKTAAERYEFMAAGDRDPDNQPGDKRFLMATGPFTMLPGDTARVVVGIVFAYGVALVPTGTWSDMQKILAIDRWAQEVYDKNFLAPKAPDRPLLYWRPLNGGVELRWDSVMSERSLDPAEGGLDFMSYRLQRQRRYSPRFTPRDTLEGWNLSWKTIATFALPPIPDSSTRYDAARTGNLSLLGAWWRLPRLADTCGTGGLVDLNPSTPAIDSMPQYRWDTLSRPGMPDTIIRGPQYVQKKAAYCFAFNPYDDADSLTRVTVRRAIIDIMDSLTGGHRYIDVGDDNNDGTITEDASDLSNNERLINNVDYFYRLLPSDAGNPLEGTVPKENSAVFGVNLVLARPEAPPPSNVVQPTIVSSSGLGGISNFQLMVLDQHRLGQMFGGDTLEFEFHVPDYWPLPAQYYLGAMYFYNHEVVVRSRRSGDVLSRFYVHYPVGDLYKFSDRQELLDSNLRSGLRDNVATPEERDSIWISAKNTSISYNGTFLTEEGRPIFNTVGVYKSTFGISFDFNFRQFGDSLRFGRFGDTTTRDNPFTVQSAGNVNLVPKAQYYGTLQGAMAARPLTSIGQPRVQVEFKPGGTENIRFTKAGKTYVFDNVPYLTLEVRDVNTYAREVYDPVSNARVIDTVRYNYTFPLDPNVGIYGDTAKTVEDQVRLIDVGSFGLFAYGWLNLDQLPEADRSRPIRRQSFVAVSPSRPVGTPGRYYVGIAQGRVEGTAETATLAFTHRLVVNGAEILIDFAGMGSVEAQFSPKHLPAARPTQDFAVGDKFLVDFTGGTAGLPSPGAKVVVAIPDPKPAITGETRDYTNDMLDQIHVVPNPYMVSHLGQRANSENLLYFTRLPEICTIQIYTESGELVKTLEHDATPGERLAVSVWDLISEANRNVASQLFIARITTPNGSEVIKKFAVVVGGFRILGD